MLSVLIPEAVRKDILRRDEKGLDGYEEDGAQDLQHLDGEDTGECRRHGHQAPRTDTAPCQLHCDPKVMPRTSSSPACIHMPPISNYEMSVTPRSMFV